MTRIKRQPRIGNRRHMQIYVDAEMHHAIVELARQQNISWSMAARQLLIQGLQTLSTTHLTHGHRAA